MDVTKGMEAGDAGTDLQKVMRDGTVTGREREGLEELNDHVGMAIDGTEGEEAGKRRLSMIGKYLRFAEETFAGGIAGAHEDLHRGDGAKGGMADTINFGTAAAAEEGGEFPAIDNAANREGRRRFDGTVGTEETGQGVRGIRSGH